MPLNMPTHGHGQGYADANFLIPELMSYVVARKGPYFADEGDFSSAGAVHIYYKDEVPKGLVSATMGSFDYGRLFAIDNNKVNGGNLITAIEQASTTVRGPTRPDAQDQRCWRWTTGTPDNGFSHDGMAYANHWYATNQIPERAVSQGFIPLYGTSIPPIAATRHDSACPGAGPRAMETATRSSRPTPSIRRSTSTTTSTTFSRAADLGDQFRQFDRRPCSASRRRRVTNTMSRPPIETRFGLQTRYNSIRVGLQDTYQTMPYDTLTN